jgi:hypothetical protein
MMSVFKLYNVDMIMRMMRMIIMKMMIMIGMI